MSLCVPQRVYTPARSPDRMVRLSSLIWYSVRPEGIEIPGAGVSDMLSSSLTQLVRSIVASPRPVTLRISELVECSVDHCWPVTRRVVVHRGFVDVAGCDIHLASSA